MEQRVKELQVHLFPYFNLFKDLNTYCWIAGGVIRDFFIGLPNKDVDIYFPNKKFADTAAGILYKQGYSLKKEWPNNRIFKKGGTTLDIIHEFNNPSNIFKVFDYTVVMAYLDSRGGWKCHKNFFTDLHARRLVRNKDSSRNYSHFKKQHAINNIERLKTLLNKGFYIDSENLQIFLQYNKYIIVSEWEIIEKLKQY